MLSELSKEHSDFPKYFTDFFPKYFGICLEKLSVGLSVAIFPIFPKQHRYVAPLFYTHFFQAEKNVELITIFQIKTDYNIKLNAEYRNVDKAKAFSHLWRVLVFRRPIHIWCYILLGRAGTYESFINDNFDFLSFIRVDISMFHTVCSKLHHHQLIG